MLENLKLILSHHGNVVEDPWEDLTPIIIQSDHVFHPALENKKEIADLLKCQEDLDY